MFKIRFWGVRGSVATAGADHAAVGGNTSCVEIACGDHRLMLDAGTGARAMGQALMEEGCDRLMVLLSHYHWDHIQGLPFFMPAYSPRFSLEVIGPQPKEQPETPLRELLAAQMRGPYFPVNMDALAAALTFKAMLPGESQQQSGLRIRTAPTRHPNTCVAYRIEHGGHAVVYATDTEHDPKSPDPDPNLLALAQGADLLIYDAQYTPEEHARKQGWGHSTPQAGAALAAAAGVKSLVLFHHDPSHNDAMIARMEADARGLFASTVAAREGETLWLAR